MKTVSFSSHLNVSLDTISIVSDERPVVTIENFTEDIVAIVERILSLQGYGKESYAVVRNHDVYSMKDDTLIFKVVQYQLSHFDRNTNTLMIETGDKITHLIKTSMRK